MGGDQAEVGRLYERDVFVYPTMARFTVRCQCMFVQLSLKVFTKGSIDSMPYFPVNGLTPIRHYL